MRIVLQDKRTNRYWSGREWIEDPREAMEFTDVTAAEQCCCENNLDAVALAIVASTTYKLQLNCGKPKPKPK